MEKRYNYQDEENNNMLNEPAIEYNYNIKDRYSPPLTDEEWADSITGDELMKAVFKHIDELFD